MDVQNLTQDRLPTWRHGRAWFGAWRAEWTVFYYPRFFAAFEKGGYDGDRVQISVGLLAFSLYLSRDFRKLFVNRKVGFDVHHGSVYVDLWRNEDRDRTWRRRDSVVLHVSEWVVGRPKYVCEKFESVPVLVPLPEGCYEAVATRTRRTWTYRFGFKTTKPGWDFRSDRGLPFSGKGESDWDCGDDGLYGWGTNGTLEDGIGHAVATVLGNRKRSGSASAHVRGPAVMAPGTGR